MTMNKNTGKKGIQMPENKQTKYAPEAKTNPKTDNHKATGYKGHTK